MRECYGAAAAALRSFGALVRLRHVACLFIAALTASLAASQHADAADREYVVHFKDAMVRLTPKSTAAFRAMLAGMRDKALYGLIALGTPPSREERAKLRAAGIDVLNPLQHNVYRVRVARDFDASVLDAMSAPPMFAMLTGLQRVDNDVFAASADPKSWIEVLVSLHPGDDPDDIEALARSYEPFGIPFERLSHDTFRATLPTGYLSRMGRTSSVRWIEPTPALTTSGPATLEAPTGDEPAYFTPIEGLSGRRVQIGVFDHGIDESHLAFGERRVVRNDAGASNHGTTVAGVIAGNGERDAVDSCDIAVPGSRGQWSGIAPRAELLDIYQLPPHGRNGANTYIHDHYVRLHGMDISVHAYEFNRKHNRAYDGINALRDALIRGDVVAYDGETPRWIKRVLQVTSAGNENQGKPRAFHTLTKQLKNALVVANWDPAGPEQVQAAGSIGPTTDGRIKPDILAPGTKLVAPSFCAADGRDCGAVFTKKCHADIPIQRQNFYEVVTGSSYSAAYATGVLALALEAYAEALRVDLDLSPPLPSTLRGLLIHTARTPDADIGASGASRAGGLSATTAYAGPTFTRGWGLIDPRAAVDVVREKRFLEEAIESPGTSVTFRFDVPKSAPRVRVTLAWDDVAADPALHDAAPKLVNDLDLVLVDPRGMAHYPWTLETHGGNPGDAKPMRDRSDRINNVEVVDAPAMEGQWRAVVSGYRVPQGPQCFSLIGHVFTGGVEQKPETAEPAQQAPAVTIRDAGPQPMNRRPPPDPLGCKPPVGLTSAP